jgi:hypothetical protein
MGGSGMFHWKVPIEAGVVMLAATATEQAGKHLLVMRLLSFFEKGEMIFH